jgi:hypothetical protein
MRQKLFLACEKLLNEKTLFFRLSLLKFNHSHLQYIFLMLYIIASYLHRIVELQRMKV